MRSLIILLVTGVSFVLGPSLAADSKKADAKEKRVKVAAVQLFSRMGELEYNRFLDNNTSILEWSSEEIAIPYIKPTTQRIHRYFPDYWVKYRNKAGKIIQEIIEVKPAKEAYNAIFLIEHDFRVMPPSKSKNPKTRTYEQLTTLINAAKWKAALDFCHKYSMKFRVVTEHQLFK